MNKLQSCCLGSILVLTMGLVNSRSAIAQIPESNLLCSLDSSITTAKITNPHKNPKIVTKNTISQDGLTDPSLWWTEEQFDLDDGRLIDNWIADTDTKVIDLIVNRQIWSSLNYLERYALINKFGAVAREYGYLLRIFNSQETCVASYSYNTQDQKWEIQFEDSFEDRFQL